MEGSRLMETLDSFDLPVRTKGGMKRRSLNTDLSPVSVASVNIPRPMGRAICR